MNFNSWQVLVIYATIISTLYLVLFTVIRLEKLEDKPRNEDNVFDHLATGCTFIAGLAIVYWGFKFIEALF